jgi:molybdopterin-synthase adenylyltransferase
MWDRYSKQRIFLGQEADATLRGRSIAIVGLGALGSVMASWLARAGVGSLTLIDRDIVELSNLQRQLLFNEIDIGRPKAQVAARRLLEANSKISVEPLVQDVTSGNARHLLAGFDLIMDGTDNFEARFLINDVSIASGTPWIYAGAIGGEGMVWPLHPPETPCLRCLMEEPPPGGDLDTCDTAGVLGPAVGVIGSWAALEAIKILTEQKPHEDLVRFDFWRNERQFLKPPRTRCRFCTGGLTEFLDARWTMKASSLCGMEGVQIRVNPPGNLDLESLRPRMEERTGVPWKLTSLALAGQEGSLEIILFRDGRALIHGEITPERARGWYNEVVGS